MTNAALSQPAVERIFDALGGLEDSRDVRAAAGHFPDGDPRRLWLEGYSLELEGETDAAMALYAQAAGAPGAGLALVAWVELKRIERDARAAPRLRKSALALEPRCLGVERAAVNLNEPSLIVEALRVRGVVYMAAAQEAPAEEVLHLSRARSLLDRAAAVLEASIADKTGLDRTGSFEGHRRLLLDRLACLFRLAEHPPFRRDADRAWQLFRTARGSADLLPVDEARPQALQADVALLELLLIPGDRIRLAITHGGASRRGRLDASVEAASVIGKRFQDALWVARPKEDPQTYVADLVSMCEAAEQSANAFSELLLCTSIAWENGESGTLAAALASRQPRRLVVVPHGPTTLVPWGFLRESAEHTYWIERMEVVIAPSAKWLRARPSRAAALGGGLWLGSAPAEEALLDGVTGVDLSAERDPSAELLKGLEHRRVAALWGHGVFDPGRPAESLLELGPDLSGSVTRVALRELLSAAIAGTARPLCPIILATCEATEVHRHRAFSDFINQTYPFLLAGAPHVLAPGWSITTLCDRLLAEIFAELLRGDAEELSTATRGRIAPMAAKWRVALAQEPVARIVESRCLRGDIVPFSDLAALSIHGGIS